MCQGQVGDTCQGGLVSAVSDPITCLLHAEPVPAPRVHCQLLGSTPEWCNVTLHCQAPSQAAVNVTWGTGSPPRPLRFELHQLSVDGRSLRLALPPSAWNATYTCSISNPADRKSASFDLHATCLWEGEGLRAWPCMAASGTGIVGPLLEDPGQASSPSQRLVSPLS